MQITIREPGSTITHFIGMLLAVFAAIPLMAKADMTGNLAAVAAFLWLLTGGLFYTVGGVILYLCIIMCCNCFGRSLVEGVAELVALQHLFSSAGIKDSQWISMWQSRCFHGIISREFMD